MSVFNGNNKFVLICGILLILILGYLLLFNNDNMKSRKCERFIGSPDIFPYVSDDNNQMIKPNCAQLNDDNVCSNTKGCGLISIGCVNNYSKLQEEKKPWEINDDMIVY